MTAHISYFDADPVILNVLISSTSATAAKHHLRPRQWLGTWGTGQQKGNFSLEFFPAPLWHSVALSVGQDLSDKHAQ